ncbi:hypothetical protein [Pseudorhodoplanes sp.]|uniref:hypothetical protein n=1 Tax=Pseudorhodoplanes sp. TaxID=1934341 RepID=UPI002CBD79D3|nr:hypothetical protein [Pseudorhodoplanes sp.]HWV44081.1 hypothetical protein [Pseudorhodoplanes sp.]
MRSPTDKIEAARRNRNNSPASKSIDRLVRRAARKGVLFEVIDHKGFDDPVEATFRSRWSYPGRFLTVWPQTGVITQRIDATKDGETDPSADACYHRWFWGEMASVAFWRTRGEYRMARRVLKNARSFRELAEGDNVIRMAA